MKHCLMVAALLISNAGMAQYVPPDPEGEPYKKSSGYRDNDGQVIGSDGDPCSQVEFSSEGCLVQTYLLSKSEARFALFSWDTIAGTTDTIRSIGMKVAGETAAEVAPVSISAKDNVRNYYLPHCGANGIEGVAAWDRAVYEDVQPYTDLHFYSGGRTGQKMAIVFRPGSDPIDFFLEFDGQDSLDVDIQGTLTLYMEGRWVRFDAATAYQVDTNNDPVPLNWGATYDDSNGNGLVGFYFDTYNPGLPLVLLIGGSAQGGPIETDGVCWASYLGGDGEDRIWASATDNLGNYYVTGNTEAQSVNFPILTGTVYVQAQRTVFLTQFDGSDEIVWSNYYGGNVGLQYGAAIAVSDALVPQVFVGGRVGSGLIPEDPGNAYIDGTGSGGFLAQFNSADGERIWSTVFVDDGVVRSLAWDKYDRLVVVGETQGNLPAATETFPNTAEQWSYSGGTDGFIALFNEDLRILWSTFIGGTAYDVARCVRVSEYKIVVAGYTQGAGFQTLDGGPDAHDDAVLNGQYDVGLLEFDMFGDQQWGTFFGGNGVIDFVGDNGLAVDPITEDVFLVGYGDSDDLPVTTSAPWYDNTSSTVGDDGWIVKFSGIDRSIVYMTYVSGLLSTHLYAVVVDEASNFFVAGQSWDTQLATIELPGLYDQPTMLGIGDGVIMAFTPDHWLSWFTRYGGNEPGGHADEILALSLKPGRLYASGSTDAAYDDNLGLFFPLTDPQNGAWFDEQLFPTSDAFVAAFCMDGIFTGIDHASALEAAHHIIAMQDAIAIVGLPDGRHQLTLHDALGRLVVSKSVMSSGGVARAPLRSLAMGCYVAGIAGFFQQKVVLGTP
jgi:hypothetical protein